MTSLGTGALAAALATGGTVAAQANTTMTPGAHNSADNGAVADARISTADVPTKADTIAEEKVYKYTWRNADSYYFDEHGLREVGGGAKLFAGHNYFYCQKKIAPYSYGGYKNRYWLRTDDDTGMRNVWVSAVYVTEGENWQAVPGVPKCD